MPESMRTIYIVGPSATGKTTLCDAVRARLGLRAPAYITEVARNVMRTQGFTRNDVGRIEMQRAIMTAQLEAEGRARESVARGEFSVMLSDRSAVDPIVYATLPVSPSAGRRNAEALISSAEFQRVLPLYRQAVFVLLKTIPEWLVDDGVRSLNDQVACWEAFREVLAYLEIPFQEIDGSCRYLEERVTRVLGFSRL